MSRSKYADKRQTQPPCAWPNCEDVGKFILVYDGSAGWFCETHAKGVKSE